MYRKPHQCLPPNFGPCFPPPPYIQCQVVDQKFQMKVNSREYAFGERLGDSHPPKIITFVLLLSFPRLFLLWWIFLPTRENAAILLSFSQAAVVGFFLSFHRYMTYMDILSNIAFGIRSLWSYGIGVAILLPQNLTSHAIISWNCMLIQPVSCLTRVEKVVISTERL